MSFVIMPPIFRILLFFIVFASFSPAMAQQKKMPGKVISQFGPTYPIEYPDYSTSLSQQYKVVFDVASVPEDPSAVNKQFETVARFLNMHAAAGKSLESMEVAVVVHGQAAQNLLQDRYYLEMFGTSNPNIALIKALDENNVQIILCGQTAVHRDLSPERRLPETRIALSAMTALIQLQNEGYRLINF